MALVPISRTLHAKTRIRPIPSFAFAAAVPVVPVYGGEIIPMSHEVPVAFTHDGAAYTTAAVVGLRAGQNLLVDPNGRWIGAHIPALWRRGPFRLARIEGQVGSDATMALCLDDSSDLISETEGQPLFDEQGAPSPMLSNATSLLSQIERDVHVTKATCAVLEQLGLFTQWPIEIARADGSKHRIADLHQIDEAKIATLSGEELIRLRDAGGLALIYAHLLSLSRINLLGRLAKMADERDQQRIAAQRGNLNLDRAFGIVEDDPFIF